MDPVCAIDSLFFLERGLTKKQSDHTDDICQGTDDHRNDHRDDGNCADSDFENLLDLPSFEAGTSDRVDANLFLGLLKILVDGTASEVGEEKAKRAKARWDFEELMELTMEIPEVAWYYRNLHLIQKSEVEAEDGCLIQRAGNVCGLDRILSFMLRECLLQRQYRQASFVVWALAALTRDLDKNADLLVTVLKATLEIFLTKTSDETLSSAERSQYRLSSLDKFIRTLSECRGMDPRVVGLDWLVLLLRNGRYEDATRLQQRIEAERRKQYHGATIGERIHTKQKEEKRVFSAFTGLACYVYAAKLLRRGFAAEDDPEVRGENAEASEWNKSVRFRDSRVGDDDDDDIDYVVKSENPMMDETRLDNEREARLTKLRAKADQLDELAAECFEEAIFQAGGPWDAFVPPYVAILARWTGGEARVLETLKKYRDAHPENPNAHRFLFEHVSKEYLDANGSIRRDALRRSDATEDDDDDDDEKLTLLRDSLASYNRLAPADKTVAFRLVDSLLLEADGAEPTEKSRRSSVAILFNLLDYPEWRTDVECWSRLTDVLFGGGDGEVSGIGIDGGVARNVPNNLEVILRAGNLAKREWFDSRADWWPKMHFGSRSADRDLESEEFKKLIKLKNSFVKFITGLSSGKYLVDDSDSSVAEKYFKSYDERIEARMRESS